MKFTLDMPVTVEFIDEDGSFQVADMVGPHEEKEIDAGGMRIKVAVVQRYFWIFDIHQNGPKVKIVLDCDFKLYKKKYLSTCKSWNNWLESFLTSRVVFGRSTKDF